MPWYMECDVLDYCIVNFLSLPTTRVIPDSSTSPFINLLSHQIGCITIILQMCFEVHCPWTFTQVILSIPSALSWSHLCPSVKGLDQMYLLWSCLCLFFFVHCERCSQTLCKGTDSKMMLYRPHIIYLFFVLSKMWKLSLAHGPWQKQVKGWIWLMGLS